MSSWLDDISGWFEDEEGDGTWFSRNEGWLKPVTGAILGGINNSNQSSARGDVASLLRGQIDRGYQNDRATYDAYVAHQQQANAARASAAAAAAANARARQQAQQRANRIQQKGIKEMMKMYEPHRSSFERLFPQMTQTYSNSMGGINSLLAALQTPEALARLNQSVSAHQTDIPLPEYLKKEKK